MTVVVLFKTAGGDGRFGEFDKGGWRSESGKSVE
jgi:hypothetical protein